MKKKVTNLKQNKSQKVSKKTAQDINVDEKEIIQTNMISSDTDEIHNKPAMNQELKIVFSLKNIQRQNKV